jgi:hypothetical protein
MQTLTSASKGDGTYQHAKIDKFRIQKSLGSVISEIKETSADGFHIIYTDGDICNKTTGERFSSKVYYLCDPF